MRSLCSRCRRRWLSYFWGWETLPILFIINLLSILLINLIVRKLDHNTFVELINSKPQASKLLKSIKQDELKIITLTKLSPVLPFTFTNFVFAFGLLEFSIFDNNARIPFPNSFLETNLTWCLLKYHMLGEISYMLWWLETINNGWSVEIE